MCTGKEVGGWCYYTEVVAELFLGNFVHQTEKELGRGGEKRHEEWN